MRRDTRWLVRSTTSCPAAHGHGYSPATSLRPSQNRSPHCWHRTWVGTTGNGWRRRPATASSWDASGQCPSFRRPRSRPHSARDDAELRSPTVTLRPPPGRATAPIELRGGSEAVTPRVPATRVEVSDDVVRRLHDACASVSTDAATLAEASRDWWPLAMTWALDGQVAGLGSVVARPSEPGQVSSVLRIAADSTIPVTAAAGRSGVCGASVPLHGGIVLDLTDLSGI